MSTVRYDYIIHFPDGSQLVISGDDVQTAYECSAFSFFVKSINTGNLIENIGVFDIHETKAISKTQIRIDIKHLFEEGSPVYIFDNGFCTNVSAYIKKAETFSDAEGTRSRELIMFKHPSGVLNAAFSTFNNYYTDIEISGGYLYLNTYFENKELQPGMIEGESFIIDSHLEGLDFFESYTKILAEKYNVKRNNTVPSGWSSWSCLYNEVRSEDITKQSKLLSEVTLSKGTLPIVLQIDDGWQNGGTFDGNWTPSEEKFAGSLKTAADTVEANGQILGLWSVPGIVTGRSDDFSNLSDLILTRYGLPVSLLASEPEKTKDEDAAYLLDISDDRTIEYIGKTFGRFKNEYGAKYFKIDFTANLLSNVFKGGERIEYPGGYSANCYRKMINAIRKSVGDDSYMLASGSPIGESIGVFDSIRVTSDVSWAGAGSGTHPGYWNILKSNIESMMLRAPFGKDLFINDPDGLLLRDFETEHCDDGVALSDDEAKVLAAAVAMSGGSILLNEEIDRIPEDRLRLFIDILPPFGIPAVPADFFEYPYSSEAYIQNAKEDCRLVFLFNLDDHVKEKEWKNPFGGKTVMMDCFSHELESAEESVKFDMPAHSCKAFLARKVIDDSNIHFFASCGDFYCGFSSPTGKSFFYSTEYSPDCSDYSFVRKLSEGIYIYS